MAEQDPAPPKHSVMFVLTVFVLSVMTCVLFYSTVLLLTVGMLPTGVAYMIDTHPRRYATKTVAWANLAGALVVTLDLWSADQSLSTAIDLLQDPLNWIIMLGGAGVGWIIYFIVPGVVLRYLGLSFEMRRKTLKDKMIELEKEWGEGVRHLAPLDDLEEIEAGPAPDPDAEDELAGDDPEDFQDPEEK